MTTTAQPVSGFEPPRSREANLRPRPSGGAAKSNFEMYGWIFQRLSGLALVVLVLGHLLIMNILDGGVHRLNFAFVSGRWSSPFWQTWDLAQLWLAELHGVNGLRTVINDYATKDTTRFTLKMLLYTATIFTLILGTLVIFTFDPNLS